MASLFNRSQGKRAKSLMGMYEEVKAFYSFAGIYKNHGYGDTEPFYVSIFSYIDDGNKTNQFLSKGGTSARQYYVYNQGYSLKDIQIPKDKRRRVNKASEFKTLLDQEVQKYIDKVAGNYADLSQQQTYKIIEQRVENNLKELGITEFDADKEFNEKFLTAVFENSKKLNDNTTRELIRQTFLDIQDFINKNIQEGTSSLVSTSKSGTKGSKKDYHILKFNEQIKKLDNEYEQLLKATKKAIAKGIDEGIIDLNVMKRLNSILSSLRNKTLFYERKLGSSKPKKGYKVYYNEKGIKIAIKDFTNDKNKVEFATLVTSFLNNAAGLGYELLILGSAVELMRQGRNEIGNFKQISKKEFQRRALQELAKNFDDKKIKIEGKTFSGAVVGDLIIDGKQSKTDVVLRIEDELRKTKTEFRISAKNYKGKKVNIHNGTMSSFASAISQKGRQREAHIARSMFDTISWYPAYFQKGKGNNSVYNVLQSMLLLNLDYFYGFDVTQLFSSGKESYENIADVIRRTSIKEIKISGDKISLFVKVRNV